MRQGEFGRTMYIIISGRVVVQRDQLEIGEPLALAELGPGDIVGEMGVLGGGPRSATVVALADTETREISSKELSDLMRVSPVLSATILQIVSERLSRTADQIAKARLALELRGQKQLEPPAA